MKFEICRIPPRTAARLVGAVFGVAGLIATIVGWLFTFQVPGVVTISGMPVAIAVVVVPIGWWLLSYALTALFCLLYNLLANHFGGIVLETSGIPGRRGEA